MQHRIAHDLSHDLARRATASALESYRKRFATYGPSGNWVSKDLAQFSFKAAGQTMSGTVEVAPKAIVIELEVPVVFRPLRKLAIDAIEDEVERWLAKARAGELG